jgi:hypothetical protein
MPVRGQEMQSIQAAISVSEMARRLTLSRPRFYELVRAGVFPSPCYCPHSRRALYPADLQQQCLAIRESNIGSNGQYVLFNRPRTNAQESAASPRRTSRERSNRSSDPILCQLREGLASLGLASLSDDQIQGALRSAFPSGTAGVDHGAILASVFRLIRASNMPATRMETA